MLFLSFFENLNSLLYGLSGFIFLLFATWYVSDVKFFKGLKVLWCGLFVLFLSALCSYYNSFFIFYGVSIGLLTFLKLFLIISASILLIAASSYILLSKPLSVLILFSFSSVGLILSFYTVFIANSLQMEQNISLIVPIIGFIYLFLSFISQPNLKKHFGSFVAAMAMLGFLEQMSFHLFLNLNFSFTFTLFLLLLLSASYFMIESEACFSMKDNIKADLIKMSENIQNIVKSSPFPIIISKLTDDSVVFANQNALKLFELNAMELERYHFKDFFVDQDNRRFLLEKLEHTRQVQDFEILVKTATGQTPFWLVVSANVIEYNSDLVLYTAFQDITSRKAREKMLQNQAERDPLTSIYNRRYFEKAAAQKIYQALQQKQSFAVLMIDADHFKKINDEFGHKNGDKVLIELALASERSLRPEDIVARYGGEEFVVFLSNVTPEIALLVANRLRETLSSSVVYTENGTPIRFTVSIGVAPSGISDSLSALIKMADDAMYLAKERGRNRAELYRVEDFQNMSQPLSSKDSFHPAFEDKDNEEISLLDGIESNHMVED